MLINIQNMFEGKNSSKESIGFKTLSSMYVSVDSSEQDYIVFHIQIKITT